MSEWTPEAINQEKARRAIDVANGICPDSGKRLHTCHLTICDCFDSWDCQLCTKKRT